MIIQTKPNSTISDHAALTNIGTNAHSAIDIALTRLANTSGSNTGGAWSRAIVVERLQ